MSQGCEASIRIQKIHNQDLVRIYYYWEHSHDPSDKFRPGPNERNWTKSQIQKGLVWPEIRAQLTPSIPQLEQVSEFYSFSTLSL